MIHDPVDVKDIGCDFLVFSGHKRLGPREIGALYRKEHLLDQMPTWQGGGGDMIRQVTFKKTTWAGLPAKFEAGSSHCTGYRSGCCGRFY